MRKISAKIRNNFWVLNAKPIAMIAFAMLSILLVLNVTLQIIDKFSSWLNS